MPRSLAVKLTLAFLMVSLIGVAMVAVFSGLITRQEFDRLTMEQAKSSFIQDATVYYQTHGSWQGIEETFYPRQPAQQPGQPAGAPPPPMPIPRLKVGLADQNGKVVLSEDMRQVGGHVPPEVLAQGTPLEIQGKVVGTVLFPNDPPVRNVLEEQYLVRTSWALLVAATGAMVIALGVGIFLTRTLTRPLSELTRATRALAKGELNQTVPVRSKDELGQLAASFNQMSADLAHANRLRRQMTADIAHDLRTPLTVITGYIEALRDGDLQPTPARFEAMYYEAHHLKRLVEDLRVLSLADAGELPLNRQSVSVPDLLARVATVYQHQAQQQHLTLEVWAETDLPNIQADLERLVQVLGNLISNALRYTPAGGRIVLSAQPQTGAVQLKVQDNGGGISPDDLPHIFNRFYRGDKSRRQNDGESGLGLAIARAIIEAHAGTISAQSELGQGTTFLITLPTHSTRPT